MREGLIGTASAILLGGALALGLSSAQDQASQPSEGAAQGGQAASSSLQPPATGYVITPEAIDCTEFNSPNTCRTTVIIRPSTSAQDRNVRLQAVLTGAHGDDADISVAVECTTGCAKDIVTFKNEAAKSVRVTLTLPAGWRELPFPKVGSGFLGVVSDKYRFEGTPRRLRVLAPSPSDWQWVVILIPGVVAAIVSLVVALRLEAQKISLSHRMGAPSWKASESWSSNLTVGAGLVNGVTALAVVSEFTVFMTKPSYAVVSMLLGAFVLLAPIVYGLSRRAVTVRPGNVAVRPGNEDEADDSSRETLLTSKVETTDFEGTVSVVLIAGALTLWASGGQLLTFVLLMGELWRFGVLSGGLAAVIAALVLGIFAGLLRHGNRSMYEAALGAKAPVPAPPEATRRREVRTSEERAPGWSLL